MAGIHYQPDGGSFATPQDSSTESKWEKCVVGKVCDPMWCSSGRRLKRGVAAGSFVAVRFMPTSQARPRHPGNSALQRGIANIGATTYSFFMKTDTLAHRLGMTTHLSPLLMKARRLGLCVPDDLERLAIQRGCRYYDLSGDSRVSEARPQAVIASDMSIFSNEELAFALLSMGLTHSQYRLRLGAAMLAAKGNSPPKIARLAIEERCEVVVRYIALCGKKVEPQNPFWDELLTLLPVMPMPALDLLPHITRFVAMTGVTRHGRETVMQWIRPNLSAAA